jgi:TetR/AcrR family transcriptional regulator, cholesterol catabolism regulator
VTSSATIGAAERSEDTPSARKQRIIAVARRHFTESGYDGTSMRQIAADVGINVATLYFHCSTKEQLFFEVLDARRRRLWDGLQAALASAGPTWTDRLGTAITFHVLASCDEEGGPIVSAAHLRRLPGELSRRYVARRDEYERQFRELVDGGIRAGEFARLDVPLAVAGILGVGFTVAQWYRPGGRLSPEQVAAEYVRLLVGGLAVREAE